MQTGPQETFAAGNDPGTLIVQRYNINSGLSSDYLTSIWQDDEGYLWITTSNGLNRFDGYTFRTYKPEFNNVNTFNSLNLNAITSDLDGNLWIGTDHSGINVFNKRTNKVRIIDRSDTTGMAILDNNINHLLCDSRGRIWICSFGGLNLYLPEKEEMVTFTGTSPNGNLYPFGTISYAYEDRRGRILIGTWGNGFYVYNEADNDFTQFLMDPRSSQGDTINRVVEILEDRDGFYWMGTWEGGLYKVQLRNYNSLEILQHYSMYAKGPEKLTTDIIYCLYEDMNGAIWAGTPYGLNIISGHRSGKPEVTAIQTGDEPWNISHNDLFHIFEDRSGIIWLATGGGGLNKINLSLRNIQSYTIPEIVEFHETQSIRSFITDRDGSLLTGVHGLGFGVYGLNDGSFIPYKEIPRFSGLPDNLNAATCFMRDTDNNLWIGTRYSGLFMISGKTGQTSHYLYFDPVTGDRSRMINEVCQDRFGNIWAGTNNGLFKLVPAGNDPTYAIYRFLPDETDPGSIQGEYISAIFEDSDTVLWVGTVGGALNTVKNEPGKHKDLRFRHFYPETGNPGAIRSNIVYDVHEDASQRIWIGTGTAGLALYDRQSSTFTHYLKQAGVREDAVYDIIEVDHDLWLSTNNGLIRFRERGAQDFQVEVFTSDDGLLGNFFIEGAFYKAPDGKIFAGSYYGINVFDPAELTSNNYIPPVAITALWIGEEQVNVYDALANGLLLKYNQNNIRVEFASLSYAQPSKNKYAYMLDGLDHDWNRGGAENRTINYSHIPPGSYTLLLNASNNSDVWNSAPMELAIRVKPHPARSWWALMIYTLVVIGILVTIYYFLINNIKIKQAYEIEKLERKKEENINQFKFRFFTNISHELLTPLSVLSFSIENLFQKQKWDGERIEIMERNVKRIMHLVSQLLDFRKMESGSMRPMVSPGRIDHFVEQICKNLEPLAEKKNITVSLDGKGEQLIYFDPDKLDKIISNLMSNALKYTPENGRILIGYDTYEKEGQLWLKLCVTDSGKGIEPEMFDQVFERFYQVKSVTGKTFGAGIGLALAKNLAENHKGTISVENAPGLGARFTVQLPVAAEAYDENEILHEEVSYQARNLIIDHDDSLVPVEEDQHEREKTDEQKTILIVEDNSDFRKLLSEHLSNYYNILEAGNGKDGFALCMDQQPDLVITDMMMPVMDGIELCKKIKNNVETSDIIVILLTAKMNEETRYESYLADADSYISKPVDVRTLYTRVESLLEQRARLVKRYSAGILERPSGNGLSVLDEKLLEKIHDIIEKKLMNTELNVLALTKELGMSNSNLYRKITRLTGMSPVEYIRYVRLQSAAKMMISEGVTVSEAAYASGFNDLSYFSKRFKKQFDMSPKKYQKKFAH
jgi:signal transduction histidine kinase/ligand-binding sensor domain-containing protein/DNA-binding response OmpR family regulator